jgi:tripartite-type tricarboxylate transporter receptor subunit TctC
VQVVFVNLAPSIGYIGSGKLRALGITTAARSEALPDVPAICEFVPGYEASSVFGIGAPRDTPTSIIDRLNQEANAALADSGFKTHLRSLDATGLGGSPADFSKLMVDETEKWAKVISLAKIRLE